jgi:hypothetical protein
MKENTRHALKSAFFEAFFVILGVGLALAANEWRQNTAAQKQADSALAGILVELEDNRAQVQASHDYHMGLVGMIQEKMGAGEAPVVDDFPRGFVSPARVADTAWDVATQTGVVSNMEYATLLELSRMYGLQDQYLSQVESVGGLIYGQIMAGGTQAIADNHRNLLQIIYTFIYREYGLLAAYDAMQTGKEG